MHPPEKVCRALAVGLNILDFHRPLPSPSHPGEGMLVTTYCWWRNQKGLCAVCKPARSWPGQILGKSVLMVVLAAGLLTHFVPCCAFAICSFSKVSATPAIAKPLSKWRSQESHKVQDHHANQLSLQDHGAHGEHATDVVPGVRGPFIRCPVWISLEPFYCWPFSEIWNFCERSFYQERTCCSFFFLRSGEGVWYHLDAWHTRRPTWTWFSRSIAMLHHQFPLRLFISSKNRLCSLRLSWTERGSSG